MKSIIIYFFTVYLKKVTFVAKITFFIKRIIKKNSMLEVMLSGCSSVIVSRENIAATMGSGDLEVFATPSMVALMENAAMKSVLTELPEGSTTVGAEMNVTHIKPSGMGAEIVATAVLTEISGRKLTFNVGARDADGMIGEGVHIRYIVDRSKFMSKVK